MSNINNETILKLKIHQRVRTQDEWQGKILEDRELGFEKDTGKIKLGDGETAWENLEYFIDQDLSTLLGDGDGSIKSSIQKAIDNLKGEVEQKYDTLAELAQAIENILNNTTPEMDSLFEIATSLNEEIARAEGAEQGLTEALTTEINRAKEVEDTLDKKIDAITLTEETVLLASNLYTYAPIGKAQTANNGEIGSGGAITQTNRGKIGNKGDTLKQVFKNIFGTLEDKKPSFNNKASIQVAPGNTTFGGGEYGTKVNFGQQTITFKLNRMGNATYGYQTDDGEIINEDFYYPIIKQEYEADVIVHLPEGKEASSVFGKGTIKQKVGNTYYCNFSNEELSLVISLDEDTVGLEDKIRHAAVSATVSLGAPQKNSSAGPDDDTITKFLTYAESINEEPSVIAKRPGEVQGGLQRNSTGNYIISAGYVPYTYCLSGSLPDYLPTSNRTKHLPNTITVSGGNDNTYLYIFVPTGKNDIKSMSAGGFAVPFTKVSNSTSYNVNNGKEATYKVFKTQGPVKGDTFVVS